MRMVAPLANVNDPLLTGVTKTTSFVPVFIYFCKTVTRSVL